MQQTRRVWATPAELVEWLQLGDGGLKKLQRMRAEDRKLVKAGLPPKGPRFMEIGREVRYAWADVHAWCASGRGVPRG